MAPTNKAKAAGVSASSFFDLKAELSKKEEEFSKAKASGKTALVGGVKRPDKKPTVWAKQNKGVASRASRDIELDEVSRPTLESAQAILARKAQIYEKLRKGKGGGLSDKQYDQLLVDFEAKPSDAFESDSDDIDESLTVPVRPNEDDDPEIEYEDEFGRMRTGRRSEIPRHLLEKNENPEEEDDPDVIYNPINHFPVYEPSVERLEAIQAALDEADNPLNVHYDASHEVRAKGAGFYQFSGDEETRRRQMEELRKAREETETKRQELGAVDLRPGEVEGLQTEQAETVVVTIAKSRAMEKRKLELEERRKLIEAKRRKLDPTLVTQPKSSAVATPTVTTSEQTSHIATKEPTTMSTKGKGKGKPVDDADAFLASLEQDILRSRSG